MPLESRDRSKELTKKYSKPLIELVDGENVSGVYFDGELWRQDSRTQAIDILEMLAEKGILFFKAYSVNDYAVQGRGKLEGTMDKNFNHGLIEGEIAE